MIALAAVHERSPLPPPAQKCPGLSLIGNLHFAGCIIEINN